MMKKRDIKISIVVPVYNVEKYLNKCAESLINQTYKNIEIIFVNDGSTDNSAHICNNYKNIDNRIIVVNKINEGLSEARNVGVDKAEGEYILFVDSDDYIEINACEEFINIINETEADIVTGNAVKRDGNNIYEMMRKFDKNRMLITGKDYLKIQLKENKMYMAAWLNLYRKDFLINNNIKFKKGLLHEDEEFTPRAFLKANKVISTNIVFYNYIIRENSITQKKDLSKNAMHIIDTCYNLEKIYIEVIDVELRKLLLDNLVSKYLYAFQIGYMYMKSIVPNKRFVLNNCYSKRNRLKAILFTINIKLYFYINTIIKRGIS